MRHQGIKGGLSFKNEIFFPTSTTMVIPKNTLLFHPESDEEADWDIQVAVDMQALLNHLNEELQEMNHADTANAAKEEHHKEQQ